MAKRGRPKGSGKPKEYDQNASKVVTLRFTPAQYEVLERVAASAGGTVPATLRQVVEAWRQDMANYNAGAALYEAPKTEISISSEKSDDDTKKP